MRIGFDISALSIPASGVGHYQLRLLEAMLRLNAEHFFYLYAFNFRNRSAFSQLNFDSNQYNLKVLPIPQRFVIGSWMTFRVPALETLVTDCELFHVSELCIPPVKKAKRVAFVHDLSTLLFPEFHTQSNTYLHRKRLEHVDEVDLLLTNSHFTKKTIVERLSIDPSKIVVTPLGADKSFKPMSSSEIKPALEAFQINKPYILYVGTLEPRKNLVRLIKAFNQLKMKRRIPHLLVLVGQRGWKYEDVFEEVKNSPVKSDILWLDYVSDEAIPPLMNGADLFCYPSLFEGFGLPILEAMQCGTPVITSNVSALPEVGGGACHYFNPESIRSISDAMVNVLSSRALLQQLSETGRQRARLFSWEKCARLTLKAYEYLM